MGKLLAQFTRSAQAMGASPAEVIAAMAKMSATVYAVELSGAETRREIKRAEAAYHRGALKGMADLPTTEKDERVEAELRRQGHTNGRTR